jgi:predicted ATP-dependent endonuclease of OLD family
MTEHTIATPAQGSITLRCVELSNFRRLSSVRLDLDEKTTVLVGANNSGKTSVLAALRFFLSDAMSFGAFDISQSQWAPLRSLGVAWQELAEDPATSADTAHDWRADLKTLRSCMPVMDLWFHAESGMYHYIKPFLSIFTWKGGAVGLRLRLEPASDVEGIQALAWRYRQARYPVKDLGEESLAWPMDLLDYLLREPRDLGRVQAYKLDTSSNPLEHRYSYASSALDEEAVPIDRSHLSRLIRVDFVAAQRGLGTEEAGARSSPGAHRAGLFSNQLLKFSREHLNVASAGHGHRADLVAAVASAQRDLDKKIHEALAPIVEDVRELGYPGLHDPQEIHFRTRIQTADLLDHGTAVQYRMGKGASSDLLPEHSIGLGYQNLQSLSYQLVSFRTARLNPEKGSPTPVHLVMIEEPEAHLHVQVQRIFSSKALKLISPVEKELAALKSQLLISTHSSHLAHAESFARLRYVRRVAASNDSPMPSTEIVNLGDVFGTDSETRVFAERYFRVQHTDLLFANAAIFIEGVAERMLVPMFIEREFPSLSGQYVSFLDIGGSHAHRLQPLVERLRIPTVIITDIDPVEVTQDEDGKDVRKAVAYESQSNLECGNPTLATWHPKETLLEKLKEPSEAQLVWHAVPGCKVRFAWQLPIKEADSCWPSSFEDALILSNLAWFKDPFKPKDPSEVGVRKPTGALAAVVKRVANATSNAELAKKLHVLMHDRFNKGDFAATIFERLASGAEVSCPRYIADALGWLQAELEPESEGLA